MPTFERRARFDRAFRRLPRQLRRAFMAALPQFIAALRQKPPAFPPSLRVKGVQGHPGVCELSFGDGGRATFAYGDEVVPGERRLAPDRGPLDLRRPLRSRRARLSADSERCRTRAVEVSVMLLPRGPLMGAAATTDTALTYSAALTVGEDGWTCAPVAELPGAISQGPTFDEAKANVAEAVELAHEWRREEGEEIPGRAEVTGVPVTVAASERALTRADLERWLRSQGAEPAPGCSAGGHEAGAAPRRTDRANGGLRWREWLWRRRGSSWATWSRSTVAGTTSCRTRRAGVTLEPAITKSVDEIHAEHGGRPLSSEEFDELFGDLPRDGEG